MRRVIVGFFAVVGFLTVLLVVGAVLLATGMKPTVTPLADNIILTVDLTQGLAEGPRQDRLLRLLVGGEPTLRDVLDGIETASGDPRVKVLLARVGDDELGLGKIQELRDAIATFRAKGKFALAFADSFGEFGPGTRPYYLATAFDEIWLQPMGNVGLTGLYAEVPFFKGTLDLLGIAPEFEHREEFKTAMNSLTETKMTPPHREGSTIALIYGSGLIQRAASSANPLTESNVMAANEMTRAFRAAVRDPAVRAIIFRIDSPGGSVVASESIWREVVFARERGKPVVVSMGDVAGSGGYYVAAAADKIVAEPATLTGSIGVLAGKLVVSDLFRKLGMSTDSAQIGANAAMYSSTSDFSARAHSRLEAFLDETYKGFKDHVASGRRMTQEEVEEVAKGRVWSGEDAKARGLVDELGGNAVALRLAKEAARLAPDAAVKLTVFPREKEAFEIIFNRLFGKERDGEDGGGASSGSIERSLRAAQPLLQRLETLLDNSGVLTMPAIGPVR